MATAVTTINGLTRHGGPFERTPILGHHLTTTTRRPSAAPMILYVHQATGPLHYVQYVSARPMTLPTTVSPEQNAHNPNINY